MYINLDVRRRYDHRQMIHDWNYNFVRHYFLRYY
jgi:hypothetical protein